MAGLPENCSVWYGWLVSKNKEWEGELGTGGKGWRREGVYRFGQSNLITFREERVLEDRARLVKTK